MATLTHAQLETLWVLHGGLQQDADVAAAIAQAESGGCQYAKAGPTDDRPVKQCSYRFTTLENSYGLWQINRNAHPQYTATSLYTEAGNATAAADIRRARGSFADWTTFTNGTYKQYLTGTVSVTPQPGQTYPPSVTSRGVQSPAAWHHLSIVLGGTVQRSLTRSQSLRHAALRKLG